MAQYRTLDDLTDIAGRRALVRVDLNVPVENGKITDSTRIERILPTLIELSEKGARIGLLSHFGRPKGEPRDGMSLSAIAPAVSEALGKPVGFADDCIGANASAAMSALSDGQIVLLENTRFHAGEEKNDAQLADAMAMLGDFYVNDAFSAAHRAHASTEGLAHRLPAYAGRAMERELAALQKALGNPRKPVLAVVGGAKVSTKIDLLSNLIKKVDALVIGGGMANTFIAAKGVDVGKSLYEPDLTATAKTIMVEAANTRTAVILPSDVVIAKEFNANAPHETITLDRMPNDAMILDIGAHTIDVINAWIDEAATLVWNGPMGAFETEPFDVGTLATARHAALRTKTGHLLSVAGGGDTVAALHKAEVADDFTYVSTAGGAFLEWMEGKPLPGVEALNRV